MHDLAVVATSRKNFLDHPRTKQMLILDLYFPYSSFGLEVCLQFKYL